MMIGGPSFLMEDMEWVEKEADHELAGVHVDRIGRMSRVAYGWV